MAELREIDDEEFQTALEAIRSYTVVLLHKGSRYGEPESEAILHEHGRRNFQLRDAGILSVVMPIRNGVDVVGVGVFGGSADETRAIIAGDPAVQAGVLLAEVLQAAGFPGDALPA
ncbi:hypothetical protein GCM10028798_31890 [Humibacter antri]